MSTTSIIGSGDFRVGDVLNRTWKIYIGNFLFLFGISFVVLAVFAATVVAVLAILAPIGAFSVLVSLAGIDNVGWWLIGTGIVLFFLLLVVLNTVAEAVLLFGIFQRLRGQPLRVGEALRRAFAQFLPLVALGIVYSLAVMVGFLLLIVPACILLVMWAVSVPACVVEGLGPLASLSRSADLTKGYRWQVFGLIIVLTLINGIGGQFFETLLGVAGEWGAGIGRGLWTVAGTALWNCGLIIIYHDLRAAKEGIDIEQIAAIFD